MSLTDEQKEFINKNYKKINNLNELTNAVFMGEGLRRTHQRRKGGSPVYGIEKDYKYNTRENKKVPPVKLNDDHKEFILANADGKMKAFDMAKILFPEKDVTPLSKETIVITDFLKKQAPEKVILKKVR